MKSETRTATNRSLPLIQYAANEANVHKVVMNAMGGEVESAVKEARDVAVMFTEVGAEGTVRPTIMIGSREVDGEDSK